MPNILVNKLCEAQFFNPESRWDSKICAHMARPLSYKHTATAMLLWRITPGLQHPSGYTRESSKRTIAGVGQIKTREHANSLMVLAVTGQSSSICPCLLIYKNKYNIYYSHTVQSNARKITPESLNSCKGARGPFISAFWMYFLQTSLTKGFSKKLWISLMLGNMLPLIFLHSH